MISVPKYADLVITPTSTLPASQNGAKLLRQVADSTLKANEVYTVTASQSCCPVGSGKNELYTLRPYFWEVKPGMWQRLDGKRNPECDKPQGQKQLQDFAIAFNALAYAAVVHKNDAYAQKAIQLIKIFCLDPETRMVPEVRYAQCIPGNEPQGDKMFAIAIRHLVLMSQGLTVLPLPPDVDAGVRAWVKAQADWMATSDQGKAAREENANVTWWYHAIYASHLAYLDPAQAGPYSQSALPLSMAPQQLFAPELARTRPRHYVLFALEALFVLAGVVGPPPPPIQQWLSNMLAFAQTVPAGQLEAEVDSDPRYAAKLAWFHRMLARWSGQNVPDNDPDGSAWEGGWNQRSRLAWALI